MSGKRKGKERARDSDVQQGVVEEDSEIPNGPWDLRESGRSYVELVAELDLLSPRRKNFLMTKSGRLTRIS
jgi:hypothetical protein